MYNIVFPTFTKGDDAAQRTPSTTVSEEKIEPDDMLSKMDYAYRQMRNEALLMLQMSKLEKEIKQRVTIVEVSAVGKTGLNDIYNWLKLP
ncbi:hypothetical protein EVAR_69490_1 [Eumeta japonica]|uniref:Uncharacterized protein n=1 Tax=Eumeta variegata TaxID=151549 RepID=A0A4C1T4G5_EUMVA|nr:hypothetical protein EVAR_69490_1 [Eumeta japonica]